MEKLLKLIKLLPEPKRSFYLHRVKELITRKQAKGLASVFDTLATTRAVEGDTVLQEEISTVQDGLSTEQQRLAKLQQEVDQSLLKIESTTGETQTALKKSLKVAREKLTKKVDRAAAINQKSVEDANKLTKATANRVDQALATMFLKAEDISNKTDGYITKKDLPKKVEVIGGTNITVVMEVSDKKIAYTVNADQLRQELIGIAGTGLSRTAADLSYLKLDASNGPITGNLTINADLAVTGTISQGGATLDATYLMLDQTTPQTLANGVPLMSTSVDGEGSLNQMVNKEYVDLAVSFIELTEFFHDDASSLDPLGGIDTYVMDETQDTTGTVVSAAVPTGVAVNIFNFATISGGPHLDRLVAGIYDSHVHCYRSASITRTVNLYYELYRYETDTTETLLGASEIVECTETSAGGASMELHLAIASEVTLAVADRLIVKWYAVVTGTGGSNPTVSFQTGGVENSHFSIKVNPLELASIFVPYTGAEANVDLGAKTLTGANLISTVATGTSPYACTSVTLNTNLNADLLDGQHGAYYLDSANFTGTNWTDLTDGGNTTLHIHDIYLLADGTRALAGAWDMGDQALTNVNIDSGNIHNDVTHTQWDTAYTHSQDTSQAHPDYLVNTGDDATVGSLTAQNYYLWNGNFVGESGGLVGWTFDSTNDDITTMVKVGIGTAAPAFKLDVYCDTADATNIARIIQDNAAGTGVALTVRQDGTGAIVNFSDGGTNRMTILDGGNVGIGTTSPVAKVHIDQAVSDAAIPVLTLDQADVSDGFINFIGSDRGVITGATNSLKSVRVELSGTVYRLALFVDV